MDIRKSLREIILVVCFFIFVLPNSLFAWTAPVNISNTTGRSDFASLAVDSCGHPHVVWEDNTSGNNEVLYCFYDGDSWSAPLNISNDPTDSEASDITVDALGHLHVAWIDYQSGEIYWTYYDGDSWSTPANISNNPGHSTCPSLVADDSGRVFISWHDIREQSDIYFSTYDGTFWSTPQNVTDDSVSSAYPDIAVDSKGDVHLVWMNYGADIEAYYSKYDGNSWSSWINISNLIGYSCYPKIALDSKDHPHVVWEEREHGYEVYYTHFDGDNWAISYKLSTGSKNFNPTIAIDSKDIAHTIWQKKINTDMEISWRFHNDTSWSDIAVVPNAPGRPAGPQIAIKDSLHVIFSGDAGDNRDIFYTRRGLSGVKPEPWRPFPQGYRLEQCYPNPFNANTAISYQLSAVSCQQSAVSCQQSAVSLKIYNILGEEVITLVDKPQRRGEYEVRWEGKDEKGKEVASGIYFYQLRAGGFVATRRMVLLH